MIEALVDILVDNLLLLPFLFPTYLVLEAIEAHAGGALERMLGRARRWGPIAGALSGAVPQCGFSAAAASLYAGGVVTAGTLVAVFLSTSDELVPVLFAEPGVPGAFLVKLVVSTYDCGSAAQPAEAAPAAEASETAEASDAAKEKDSEKKEDEE